MKSKIAATAFLLLLLTLGAEAACNDTICSLDCVSQGYKNGGRCVGFPSDRQVFCKCYPNRKDAATLGSEQNQVVRVEVKPHHRKMLASGRTSLRVHGDGLDLES